LNFLLSRRKFTIGLFGVKRINVFRTKCKTGWSAPLTDREKEEEEVTQLGERKRDEKEGSPMKQSRKKEEDEKQSLPTGERREEDK
jgi:hypothetical protein